MRLPRQIPYAMAMEILLTGQLISAQRALSCGFLNYVVKKEEVLPTAMKLARTIAENGATAVKWIRKSAKACIGLTEAEGMKVEEEMALPVVSHPDAIEGPKAFKEKRQPSWVAKL